MTIQSICSFHFVPMTSQSEKPSDSPMQATVWLAKAAIPLTWFRRWFEGHGKSEKSEKPRKLNAIILEDRIPMSF